MPLELLTGDDVPPAGAAADDVAPLVCQEPGCTNTLEYSGRGRRPKFCEEHKTKSSSGTGDRKSVRWAAENAVRDALLRYFDLIGWGVQLVNELDGKIIANGAPAVVDELVKLGQVDKQWRRWLEAASKPGKYGGLILAVGSTMVLPIMANHNALPQFRFTPPEQPTQPIGGVD